jgi:hypothetical protein
MERVSVCVAEVIHGEGGTRMYTNEAEKEFFWGSVSGSTGEAVGRMWVVQTRGYDGMSVILIQSVCVNLYARAHMGDE